MPGLLRLLKFKAGLNRNNPGLRFESRYRDTGIYRYREDSFRSTILFFLYHLGLQFFFFFVGFLILFGGSIIFSEKLIIEVRFIGKSYFMDYFLDRKIGCEK